MGGESPLVMLDVVKDYLQLRNNIQMPLALQNIHPQKWTKKQTAGPKLSFWSLIGSELDKLDDLGKEKRNKMDSPDE